MRSGDRRQSWCSVLWPDCAGGTGQRPERDAFVAPAGDRYRVALVQQVIDERQFRSQIPDIECVDQRRDDEDRPLQHLVRGWGVWDQFKRIFALDDMTFADARIVTEVEL